MTSIPGEESDAEAEARYGIVRVPADRFEIGGYRYTNVADAISEAKRRESKAGRHEPA